MYGSIQERIGGAARRGPARPSPAFLNAERRLDARRLRTANALRAAARCRALALARNMGRDRNNGTTRTTGPPATEGTSRRRVHTQVTHPARTIIGTDTADARRPVVGLVTSAAPAAPIPPEPTACTNRLNSRVLRRPTVGVADGGSITVVSRASGPPARTRPIDRDGPVDGRARAACGADQPTGEGFPPDVHTPGRRGRPPTADGAPLAPEGSPAEPDTPPARKAPEGLRTGCGCSRSARNGGARGRASSNGVSRHEKGVHHRAGRQDL